uniref:Uncharacterized protein n=1 Tax=Picea glauca TaxID=3330 RepID=A0A101M531_PICGL|nr:hypothetical protein ABT39_MTgene1083 [Picea glauca]
MDSMCCYVNCFLCAAIELIICLGWAGLLGLVSTWPLYPPALVLILTLILGTA